MTAEEVKNLTEDEYLRIDEKIAKEIDKGYKRADRLSDEDYEALPEDWEDRLTDDALLRVLGTQEAIDAWQLL